MGCYYNLKSYYREKFDAVNKSRKKILLVQQGDLKGSLTS